LIVAENIGLVLSLSGSAISIAGALYNNLQHKHHLAMKIWVFSNVILSVWAFGYAIGWWTSGIGAGFIFFNYLVFTVSNIHGLIVHHEK
jgi:hypothetical protein